MKVLAVTGGARGIGRAVALRFANAGYAVSIADPDAAAGREAVRIIRSAGVKCLFVRADVGVPAQIGNWIARTVGELGCPDALVNNAGIGKRAPFLKLKARDFDRVIAVNLRGTFLCSQGFARHMARRGGGAIVNIASTSAFMSEAGTEAYTASKGGIVALTHGMAISLGPAGHPRELGEPRLDRDARGAKWCTPGATGCSIRSGASASPQTSPMRASTSSSRRAS